MKLFKGITYRFGTNLVPQIVKVANTSTYCHKCFSNDIVWRDSVKQYFCRACGHLQD